MRWVLCLIAACGSPSPNGNDGVDAVVGDDSAPGVDAAVGCPDALFGTFAMPQLSARSNVCVPSATCTFTRIADCSASFRCEYELAGVQTGDVTFVASPVGFHATFTAGERRHDWVLDGDQMAYRVVGSLADHHTCMFTNGGTDPVFPTRGTGGCPDLTRGFKLRQLDPHICSTTLRCGVFQHADDSCTVDAFCTYPTGTTDEHADIAVTRSGSSGPIVLDSTSDPQFPEHYELRVQGDFTNGTGAALALETHYFFNATEPTCSWGPNGAF
jgi:hypothetical protein